MEDVKEGADCLQDLCGELHQRHRGIHALSLELAAVTVSVSVPVYLQKLHRKHYFIQKYAVSSVSLSQLSMSLSVPVIVTKTVTVLKHTAF